MPSDNFEKSLQRRFQSVEIPPRPEVWEGIQTKLAEPRWYQKGKWMLSLAAIGLIFLCLSAYWWMSTPSDLPGPGGLESIAETEQKEPIPLIPSDKTGRDKDLAGEKEPAQDAMLPSSEGEKTLNSEPQNPLITVETDTPLRGLADKDEIGKSNEGSHLQLDSKGIEEFLENSALGTASGYIPVAFMNPEMSHDFTSKMELTEAPISLKMDQLTGSPNPGPSKWAIGFYVRPELPWYTSASISLEQDPPRSTEIDDPTATPEMSDVDGMIANQDRPSLVFYEITYARSALSAGFTLGYYLSPKLSIQTGLGVFSSGSHRLVPMNPGDDTDTAYNRGNTFAASSPSEFSDRNLQLEIPILAQYTFASERNSWVIKGGISVNQNLRKIQGGSSNDESNPNFFTSTESILTQKSTNLHAELGILYRFHLNSKLNLYVGPTQTYGLSPVYSTQHGKSIYLNRLALQMGIELR